MVGRHLSHTAQGNPFVTPETTRDVVISARLSAINLHFEAIEKLMFELSIWRCNKETMVCPTHKIVFKEQPSGSGEKLRMVQVRAWS